MATDKHDPNTPASLANVSQVALLQKLAEMAPPRYSEVVDISVGDHTFGFVTTCLHVGAAGDIVVEEAENPSVNVTYKGVPAGEFRGRLTKVIQTGTTATGLVGRW